ncbi:uncharacterized protein LOC122848962 [Aphidius gifuensis]|uniref:uncharacterized protein LOC122848962 n=1 Tax=Aphidius gifuensis TaxID=684658 RepID=UPI001CDB6D79|nr:uncharacterized protein LOC122848962 [Aphidius gifuensis]XP_044003394.1 uncharacterized protein LOC122848962 [Aphidius gifuensis]
MSMETANLSPTEWFENVIGSEILQISEKSLDDKVVPSIENNNDDDDEYRKKRQALCDLRINLMKPLFASQPRFERIYEDCWNELQISKKSSDDRVVPSIENNNDDDDDDDDDEYSKKRQALCDLRINLMKPLFASQPQFEKKCKDCGNGLQISKISLDDRVVSSIENNNNDDDDEYSKKRQAQCDLHMDCMDPLFAEQLQLKKLCKDRWNKFQISKKFLDDRVVPSIENNNNDDDDEYSKKRQAQCDLHMDCIDPLFADQLRFKKICEDEENEFYSSGFTTYTFNSNENDSAYKPDEKANDLEYLINSYGICITCLDLQRYPTSQIMLIINANCPNLDELSLRFKEIKSQDFENCFSIMSHLRCLTIDWQCKNSTIPMTLTKSIEQVGETLEKLYLSCTVEKDIILPDSFAAVFPRLTALEHLTIFDFELSQLLLQSIGEMENLTYLALEHCWSKEYHPSRDSKIIRYPIGNLKNLKRLHIESNYGVEDEFLIKLCNNAKNLNYLHIIGTHITDNGISAIGNLEELEDFDMGLNYDGPQSTKNEFITDKSIQSLFNQKLFSLDISNCRKVTDEGVIQLVKNLPNLDVLFIENTKVTRGAVRRMKELSKRLTINY